MLQCEHHTIHWLSLVLACCFQIRLSMRNIKDFNFVTLLLFTSYWGFYTQGRVLITFCRALLPSLSHWTWWVRAVTELPVFRSCRGCISLQNSSKPTRPTGPKRLVFVTNMCHFQYTRIQECFVLYLSPSHLLAKASKHQSFDWAENSWCPECPVGEIFRMIGGKIKAHLTCRPSGWIHNSPTQKFRIIEICAIA